MDLNNSLHTGIISTHSNFAKILFVPEIINHLAVTAALLNEVILSFVLATITAPQFFQPVTQVYYYIQTKYLVQSK